MAAGSSTGTLSVCNIPMALRNIPEPSFLYNWMSTHELKSAKYLYQKLSSTYQFLHNVQVRGRAGRGGRAAGRILAAGGGGGCRRDPGSRGGGGQPGPGGGKAWDSR